MKSYISIAALALLAAMPAVQAHVDMVNPAPINHKNNKFSTNIDYSYTSPATEICKGQLKAGGAALTPVATWQAGSEQTFTLNPSAVHGGGSCQASISEDSGKTFKTIKTWIGGCVSTDKASLSVAIPKETKSGQVIFAWSWFNKVGNREMYMNCASIEISNGGSGLSGPDYPPILLANLNNGCSTAEGADILIPNPGKNVENNSQDAKPPVGNCGTSPQKRSPQQPPKEKRCKKKGQNKRNSRSKRHMH